MVPGSSQAATQPLLPRAHRLSKMLSKKALGRTQGNRDPPYRPKRAMLFHVSRVSRSPSAGHLLIGCCLHSNSSTPLGHVVQYGPCFRLSRSLLASCPAPEAARSAGNDYKHMLRGHLCSGVAPGQRRGGRHRGPTSANLASALPPQQKKLAQRGAAGESRPTLTPNKHITQAPRREPRAPGIAKRPNAH